MKIQPEENRIEDTNRIADLTGHHLIYITCDYSGWNELYKDPSDGRYWEHIYLKSEYDEGKTLVLRTISYNNAQQKYEINEEQDKNVKIPE